MNNENQFEEEKKEVPTPPPSQAGVRTMQSDLKSVQESGGQAPQPYLIEIDHQPTVPAATLPPTPKTQKPEKQSNKSLFIILGILVLIFIIVLGLIWLY